MLLLNETDGIKVGSYVFPKTKEGKKDFIRQVEYLSDKDDIYPVNIEYGFRKDIKCYYINVEYYERLEYDEDEIDIDAINQAEFNRELEKVTNWETRKYESIGGS